MTRPRAADDFAAIRARREELRVEPNHGWRHARPQTGAITKRPLLVDKPATPPKIRRFLLKYGRALGKFCTSADDRQRAEQRLIDPRPDYVYSV